jgi:beta-lactamase regulating signal transducer with metallopeptidase domain
MNELLLRAADWWLGAAVGGGIVLLVGCVLMRLTRHPAARQRLGEYAVFAALIVAGLRLLPAWLPVTWEAAEKPNSSAAFPGGEGGEISVTANVVVDLPESLPPSPLEKGAGGLGLTETQADSTIPTSATSWHNAAAYGMAAYLLIAAALGARWLLGQWALSRLLRQARPAASRIQQLFMSMAAGAVWPLPRLRLSQRLRAPVCFGLRRPAVLLPEPMEGAADAQLRWVFAHELTHLRRRDPWSSWGLGLAQAVYFFLPWFWWIRRQVRLCQEYVADAAAAGTGPAADEYAEFLVSLARGSAPLGAMGLGNSSDLLRRVQMLLNTSTRVQGSWPRGQSLLAAGALLAVAFLAGSVGLRAEPPKDENKSEEAKGKVVIFKYPTDAYADYVKQLVDLPGGTVAVVEGGDDPKAGAEKVQVLVRVVEDEDEKKTDPTAKKQETKVKKMVIVIDTGDGPVTIPIDPNTEDLGKAVENAMKKARLQRAADQKKRADAIEKALAALPGELSEEQIKELKKQIDKSLEAQRMKVEKAVILQGQSLPKVGALRVEDGGVVVVNPAQGLPTAKVTAHPYATLRLGIRVKRPSVDLADQLDLPHEQGLVIVEVVKDSAAAEAGMIANDILLELAGKAVASNPGSFAKSVDELKAGEEVAAVVLRKGHKVKHAIKVPELKKGTSGTATYQLQIDGATGAISDGKVIELRRGVAALVPPAASGASLTPSYQTVPDAGPETPKPKGGVRTPPAQDQDVADPVRVEDLQKQLVDLQNKIAQMAQTHGKNHPALKVAQDQIMILRQVLGEGKKGENPAAQKTVSIQVVDSKFTAEQKEGNVAILVTGTVNDGKVAVDEILVVSPDGKNAYKKLSDVPKKYYDAVKRLISNTDESRVPILYDGNRIGR